MSSIEEMFGTSNKLETSGITVRYGRNWVRIARAGGANKEFARVLEDTMKPYRRAIQLDAMDEKLSQELMHDVYAKTIVLGWGNDDLGDGLLQLRKNGEPLKFSRENVIKAFQDFPELFLDIVRNADQMKNFKNEALEEEAKN
jgi:hypothetical protein